MMKRILFILAFLCVLDFAAMAQGAPPLRIREADGSPSKLGISTIVVTNGSLTISGTTATIVTGGGASGITIGTTTITSGTNTRVLYNNSGVVGEYAVTGTGNVAMSASPTFSGTVNAAAITATGDITYNGGTSDKTALLGSNGGSLAYLWLGANAAAPTTNNYSAAFAGNIQYLNGGSSGMIFAQSGSTTVMTLDSSGRLNIPSANNGGQVNITSGDTGRNALTLYSANATTVPLVNFKLARTNTSTLADFGVFSMRSSGTPAAGFGGQFNLQLSSNTTADRDAGTHGWGWISATDASRTSFQSFSVTGNAVTHEIFKLVGGASGTPATGLSITSAAAGSGVTLTALSSGSNESILLVPKGTGGVQFPNGAVASPAINLGDVTTGFYRPVSNTVGVTVAGVNTVRLEGNNGILIRSDYWLAYAADTSFGSPDIRLRRTAASQFLIDNGGSGVSGLLHGRVVTARTADLMVTAAASNTFYTNTGASGTVNFTLPTAAAGLTYTFYIDAAQTLTIIAGASTTIRSGSSVTTSAGNVTANTQGNLIRIVAISTTQWVAESITGTWTFN